MSFLTKTFARPLPARSLAISSRLRTLHTTGLRAALNETDRDREGLHEEIDGHKNDQLEKQKQGKGHWKGELASQSEAALKADRGEINASEAEIDKLQKETSEFAQKKHGGKA